MTDLDVKQVEIHKRITFLNYLKDSFPKGINLALIIIGAISLTGTIGEIWIVSKLLEMEVVRDQVIKERKASFQEMHQLKMGVDSALHNNNQNTITLGEIKLYLKNQEIRGLQNRIALDSIQSILVHKHHKE